jgi:hypothetical protein
MVCLRPVPVARHASPATSVHSDVENCTHVFLHQDITRQDLEPPYGSPYQVLSRRDKTLQLLVRGRPVTVSTDRIKPAYMLNETDRGTTTTLDPAVDATPAVAPPAATPPPVARTTRSGRHALFLALFNIWATISAGGGGDVGPTHIEPSASRSPRTTAAPTPIGSRAA